MTMVRLRSVGVGPRETLRDAYVSPAFYQSAVSWFRNLSKMECAENSDYMHNDTLVSLLYTTATWHMFQHTFMWTWTDWNGVTRIQIFSAFFCCMSCVCVACRMTFAYSYSDSKRSRAKLQATLTVNVRYAEVFSFWGLHLRTLIRTLCPRPHLGLRAIPISTCNFWLRPWFCRWLQQLWNHEITWNTKWIILKNWWHQRTRCVRLPICRC